VLLGGCVEGFPLGAAACERSPALDVNVYVVELAEVDDDPAVTGGKAGNAVRTAAQSDRQSLTSRKPYGSRNVVRRPRPYN
jgi:hypothetical protein